MNAVDGNQVSAQKRDGRYVIAIENIPAHELGDFHEVRITTDEECVLTVSPLSYVNAVLAGDTELDAKQAMASCYKYFEKTIAYRDRFGINS